MTKFLIGRLEVWAEITQNSQTAKELARCSLGYILCTVLRKHADFP